jgi:peroxiredoxin Q/BCP
MFQVLRDLFSKPLRPGTVAPPFELPDQDGKPVHLESLRGGNVLLVFYPGDSTPGCRRQLCELRDRADLLLARRTQVLGINPQGAGSHRRFRERNGYPFPLLVDAGKAVCRLYRTAGPVTRRTVYLIDPDGIIRFAERGKPDPERVLAALD